jgi:hypothetical protein
MPSLGASIVDSLGAASSEEESDFVRLSSSTGSVVAAAIFHAAAVVDLGKNDLPHQRFF